MEYVFRPRGLQCRRRAGGSSGVPDSDLALVRQVVRMSRTWKECRGTRYTFGTRYTVCFVVIYYETVPRARGERISSATVRDLFVLACRGSPSIRATERVRSSIVVNLRGHHDESQRSYQLKSSRLLTESLATLRATRLCGVSGLCSPTDLFLPQLPIQNNPR